MNLILQHDRLVTALAVVTSGVMGFLLRVLWDRFLSEQLQPVERLLERLQKETLGEVERKRLRRRAEAVLTTWKQNALRPKLQESNKQIRWPRQQFIISPRSFAVPSQLTACPIPK